MKTANVTGLTEIIAKLKRANSVVGKGCEIGLKRGGLLIQRESMKEVPVDQGNLRASSWCRKLAGTGYETVVGVGYTAEYAIFVHENLEAAHGEEFNRKYSEEIARGVVDSRGKGQKAKFLEDPVKRLRKTVVLMTAQGVAEQMRKLRG